MAQHLKSFKQFINEERLQTYRVQIDPYTSETDMRDGFAELLAWCTYRVDRGSEVYLIARTETFGAVDE